MNFVSISPPTWIHQICRDMGIPVTDALELAEDTSFWRQIATAGCYGWSLRAMMMMMSPPKDWWRRTARSAPAQLWPGNGKAARYG